MASLECYVIRNIYSSRRYKASDNSNNIASFADPSDSEGEIPEVDLSINIKPYIFDSMIESILTGSDTSSETRLTVKGKPTALITSETRLTVKGKPTALVTLKQQPVMIIGLFSLNNKLLSIDYH